VHTGVFCVHVGCEAEEGLLAHISTRGMFHSSKSIIAVQVYSLREIVRTRAGATVLICVSPYLDVEILLLIRGRGSITDDLMQKTERCPKISTFLFANPSKKFTAEGPLNFLNSRPSITDPCSWSSLKAIIDKRAWLHFGQRPSLQKFSLLSNQLSRCLD